MKKSILVIDDDKTLRYSLSKALKRHGFTVHEAHDLQSSQLILKNEPVNHVLLDLKLQKESGLVLAQSILAQWPQLNIVMLTGFASIKTAVEAIKIGVKDYLIKPVSIEEILNSFQSNNQGNSDIEINESTWSPKRLEWEHIQKVLLEHDGNISQTAKALNMHRRTLQRKLQKKPVKK
ncbi:response regulator transcription factor [Marinicella rhabdoformis]|uniref:response regulator transcription factor n=1 Tax=Marinicella rhabdoformis TaxID=2580566 RepID=UPI0012AEB756|nr:response regulator [Marinicella rhabdoformis]